MQKITFMNRIETVILPLLMVAFFVTLSRNAHAQYITQYTHSYIGKETVLDSAKVRIMYSLNYMPDSLNPKQIFKDRKVLLIGDKLNYFYTPHSLPTFQSSATYI